MNTSVVSESVYITLPNADVGLLRALAKKMGWTMKRQCKSGIEKGLEDIEKGIVFQAKNSGHRQNHVFSQ